MERLSEQRAEEPSLLAPSPHYYVWSPGGKSPEIRLDFDVIDRLNTEVMRGLGAVPRRGAEVGGLLLGSIDGGERTVVHIRDFEPISCEHKRGPSYLLSENDARGFAESVARWRSDDSRLQVVGFCRSHTRDGLFLAPEDLELFDRYFDHPSQVVLLIRPFATKVARAGFFFRENGTIDPAATLLEFPFRRKELGGPLPASPGNRNFGMDDTAPILPRANDAGAVLPSPAGGLKPPTPSASTPSEPPPVKDLDPVTTPEQVRRSWVWIPLSFVFLMLGVLIGFQVAIHGLKPPTKPAPVPHPIETVSLGLNVLHLPDETNVTWNRNSPIIRAAIRGVLHIREGAYYRAVDLRAADLRNGSVIVRKVTHKVEFRLEVYQKDNLYVSESSVLPTAVATPARP